MYRSRGDDQRSAGAPSVANRLGGPVSGTAVQLGTVHGDVYLHTPESPPDLLQQLPTPSRRFVNRRIELRAMSDAVSLETAHGQAAIICLSGLGGIGKTELAVRFLHKISGNLEGHLHIDLRGFSVDETVQPSEVLGGFLSALGIPAEAIPPDLGTRAAWWRSATAGRRFGVLLDNAGSAAQVRALLPGVGRHVVVVTSRVRLTALTLVGARILDIGPLDPEDATALLVDLASVAAAPLDDSSAARVAMLCGGLPIALTAVGVRAASGQSLGALEAQLRRRGTRLAALTSEEGSVRAAFDLSYDALPAEAAMTYRRASWNVGPDITVSVAQALTGLDAAASAHNLHILAAASMLSVRGEQGYRLHDLLDLHARHKAAAEESDDEQHAALSRLATSHARMAKAADRALRPYAATPTGANPFTGPDEALAWLETERANLLALSEYAASQGMVDEAVGIAEGMWPMYLHRRDATGWLRAGTAVLGLDCETPVRGRLLGKQALALGFLGRAPEAEAAFTAGDRIWSELEDHWRLAQNRQRRGLLALGAGHPDRAIASLRAALALYEELDRDHDRAITQLGLGRALVQTGDREEASVLLQQALQILESSGDDNHTARARIALASATMPAAPENAHAELTVALESAHQRGSLVGQAEAHEALGDCAAHRADAAAAREHYRSAIQMLTLMGARGAAMEVEQRMAGLAQS